MRNGHRQWLISMGLASMMLVSQAARSQQITGPATITTTVNVGSPNPPNVTIDSGPGQIFINTGNAVGILVTSNGLLTIPPGQGTFITTTGTNNYGINISAGHPNQLQTLNNVSIMTSGAGAHGIFFQNPNIILTGTAVTVDAMGPNASALFINQGGQDQASFSASTLTSAGPVIGATGGGTDIIMLSSSSVIAGSSGQWLSVTGGGTIVNVTAQNGSVLSGNAVVASGNTGNINLLTGSEWTGAAFNVTNVMVDPTSTWTVTANSTVSQQVTNAGLIEFTSPGPASAFKTLTTVNYMGQGGTLGLNTFLGADGSPSDQLVINGGTGTGTSLISITNVGGPGAETTANGILVVNAIGGATTSAAAFTLLNPELRAGAFDYRLFQGGINGSDPNSWFLRSGFIVPPVPPGPEPPGPVPPGPVPPGPVPPGPGPEVFPTEPPPGVLPPGLYPIIGPELATYGVVQPIAREMGITTIGSLHERIGDTLAADPCHTAAVADTGNAMYRKAPTAPTGCTPSAWVPSVWARGFGQQVSNHYRALADPRADGSVAGIQSGFDLWRGAFFPWGRDVAGLFFAYSNASIDVNGLVTNPAATSYVLSKTGTLNLNAWSGGAYWTHYGPGGWYLDVVLQGTDYEGSASTQFAKLTTNGWGFISSAEAGYPIPILWLGPGFVLEPQAQILWQQVSFNSGNDGLGDVALGTTSGTTGRIGVRGKWTLLGWYGQVWEPYLRVNLWQDWGGQATTTFSGIDFVPLLERATRLETAAGLTARLSNRWSLYAQGGYQFALNGTDGGRRDGLKGDLGVRYAW